MSEKEKKITETLKRVLPDLTEAKQEYLLGLADGMAVMADRQRDAKKPPGKNAN